MEDSQFFEDLKCGKKKGQDSVLCVVLEQIIIRNTYKNSTSFR